MIKKIAFDIDGTLIDWEECYYDAILPAFNKELEKEIFLDVYNQIENNSLYMTKEILLSEFNKKNNSNYDMKLIDNIINLWGSCVPNKIDENTISTLKYLSKKYELVILTNALSEIQKNRLKSVGLIKYFKKFYCAELGLKPNKQCFDNLLDNCTKNEVLIIGDNKELDYSFPIQYGFKAILLDKSNKYDNIDNKIINIDELKNIL